MWYWVGGSIVCRLYGFLLETTYTASIATLVVISYERLTAISDPLNARARNFSNKGYRKIVTVWGGYSAHCSPLLALYQLVDENGEMVGNNTTWGRCWSTSLLQSTCLLFLCISTVVHDILAK